MKRSPGFRLLLLLLLPCLSADAGAEWLSIGRSDTFRAYLDRESPRKSGDFVQVVQLMDFVTAQWVDARTVVWSIRSLVEYDCRQVRSRTLAVEAYSEQMGEGTRVADERMPEAEWENVPPGSTSEKTRQMVCGK